MRSGPRAACNTRRRCADPFGRAPVVPAPSRPARAGASNNREPDITGSARGERRVAMVVATAREAVPPAPMPADAAGRDGCPRRRNGARSATIGDYAPALPLQASTRFLRRPAPAALGRPAGAALLSRRSAPPPWSATGQVDGHACGRAGLQRTGRTRSATGDSNHDDFHRRGDRGQNAFWRGGVPPYPHRSVAGSSLTGSVGAADTAPVRACRALPA